MDDALSIVEHGGILIKGEQIIDVDKYSSLAQMHSSATLHKVLEDAVAMPGLIDAHTHICFAGSRSKDFAARNSGIPYQEIAKQGGGIWSTVKHTRQASKQELVGLMKNRLSRLVDLGITTVEIKSGYGLSVEEELKLLRAIDLMRNNTPLSIIPTCLAAHIVPREYENAKSYIQDILNLLVPEVKAKGLCNRFDIFVEDNAFSIEDADLYLSELKKHGFDLTVHGDQFTTGGSEIAVRHNALSVDHLEVSTDKEIGMIAESETVAMALPGASLGLGCDFTPCRKILDANGILAIASDWNPGSAPMGNLLVQASVLATYEKLSAAEVLAGITFRAAHALGLKDRGRISKGQKADISVFPTADYSDILYQQGSLLPHSVWKDGLRIK
ncbi:MAG: imidazolonepropionase [Saprospiraceae bacterium]|nr:imidazolonepropionase [Saprospiraceae bacterium]